MSDDHPEFTPGAYDFRPEDEVDGSKYTTSEPKGIRLICLRPGCEYEVSLDDPSQAGEVGKHHEATAHSGERDWSFISGANPDGVIWDDQPPEQLPWSEPTADVMQFYRDRVAEGRERGETAGEYIARNQARMDEVQVEIDAALARCATWVYPAAVTAVVIGLVWLSYRRARR